MGARAHAHASMRVSKRRSKGSEANLKKIIASLCNRDDGTTLASIKHIMYVADGKWRR